MSIKETRADGREIFYPDGDLIGRSVMARAFDCSPFTIERIFKRAGATIKTRQHPITNTNQPCIVIEDFPKIISTLQSTKEGKDKLRIGRDIDTSDDFRIITSNGTIFEYTHPIKI